MTTDTIDPFSDTSLVVILQGNGQLEIAPETAATA